MRRGGRHANPRNLAAVIVVASNAGTSQRVRNHGRGAVVGTAGGPHFNGARNRHRGGLAATRQQRDRDQGERYTRSMRIAHFL